MTTADPAKLLGYARLATGSGDDTAWGRSWERIAAFLTRTALESAVTDGHAMGPDVDPTHLPAPLPGP